MTKRIKHILPFLFFWLEMIGQTSLTLPQYRQYTLRDGLSQMQVISMFQDSRGYIWVGTKDGLNCYNGNKFERYTTSKYPEIINDYIHNICEDSEGRIWASTNAGILRVDGNYIHFFAFESDSPPSITTDKQGKLWFTKMEYPKFKISINYIEADSIKPFHVVLTEKPIYTHIDLEYIENEDVLLLSNDSILYRIKNNKSEIIHRNRNLIHFFPGFQNTYFIDGYQTKTSSDWETHNFDLNQYKDGKIRLIAKIRDGKLAENIDLKENLYYVTVLQSLSTFLLTPDSIYYDAFENLQISQIIHDRDGNYWIGSEEGIFQLYGKAFTAYNREFLPQIWAVTEDKKGNLWFSSFLYGLYKQEKEQLKYFPNSFIKEASYFYFHPVMDKRGRLFFPNGYGFLMTDGTRFAQKTEQIYLTAFYDIKKDIIWGGSQQRAVALDATLKKVRIIDASYGLNVGTNVLTIGKDTSGFYWFGGGSGLARYNWEKDTLKNYNPGNMNFGVVTQCNDYNGRTWFGSEGGLFWYDANEDSIIHLNCSELTEPVNMVATIDSSWLIASQPYGIYLLDLKQYYKENKIVLHLFNEKNGFTGIEPGQDGAFTDSKGNVWMTTSTELMKLDPGKLKLGKHTLTVRFDKYNGKKLPFTAQIIELPSNQNSVVVTFDAICFSRPNQVEYSWKLENDTTWSAWQQEDYAVLSDLSDGKTRFMVRAQIKGYPIDVPALAEIEILVRMAIYRQPWFFPALFAFISLAGIAFLLLAIIEMKRAGKEARAFQVQAIQSQMNPHFIFNVLASLQSMILKNNISKANDYLVKLAELIRGFLEASAGTGTLKSPKSSGGQVPLSMELKLLTEFVEFQQVINPERFDFETTIDNTIDPENEFLPPMLIQPFLENAIRHGILPSENKGLLKLSILKADEGLVIEIADNGIGIEKASRMLENSPMRYTSRGKELTMKRIELLNQLGFKIETETTSNQNGTLIKIKLFK
ncbi:MAG: histidine kinase [Prolixibacteraceae bacterium]|nr:histidine kinase [Prolixibacteraceae bacterium]